MQVCPFDDPTAPFAGPGNYAAGVDHQRRRRPGRDLAWAQPKWRYFTSNPTLDWSPTTTPKNSVIGCWTADRRLHAPPPARSRTSPPPGRGTTS